MTSLTPTHESAFLAAILADPENDQPRLIYADWLEESGQKEMAEFIRIGCELAKFGGPPKKLCGVIAGVSRNVRDDITSDAFYSKFRDEVSFVADVDDDTVYCLDRILFSDARGVMTFSVAIVESVQDRGSYRRIHCRCFGEQFNIAEFDLLRRREQELLAAYGREWSKLLLLSANGLPVSWTWRRGFIDRIECHLSAWLAHGPAIVRLHPVRELVVTDKEPVKIHGGTWDVFFTIEEAIAKVPHVLGKTHRWKSKEAAVAGLGECLLAWARENDQE